MNKDVSDSVGDPKAGAANRTEDVKTVQGLLNVQMVKDRLSGRFLAVDGRLGSQTLGAIGEFQRRHRLPQTGLIKRGDATIHALASFSGPRSMRVGQAGLDLIEKQEGYSPTLYDRDGTAGNTTIGWGHEVHPGKINHSASEEKFKNGITRLQAEQLLRGDVSVTENRINSRIRLPLTQNQFDALASLVFNIRAHFDRSTLLRLLDRGDYLGAASHFKDFQNAHHKLVPGLPDRRRAEEELFLRR
jgi:lysozyme